MSQNKLSKSEIGRLINDYPSVRTIYSKDGHYEEKSDIRHPYTLPKGSTGPAQVILRILINLKLNYGKIKKYNMAGIFGGYDELYYIESEYLTGTISGLWVAQSDTSGFSGHNSNTFISEKINNKKCSIISRELYDVITSMEILLIDSDNKSTELNNKTKNALSELKNIDYLVLNHISFDNLHLVHLKLVNSHLKQIFKGEKEFPDRDGNKLNLIMEKMHENEYSSIESSHIKKTFGESFDNKFKQLLKKNGIAISRQKYWIRNDGNKIDIIRVSNYLMKSPRAKSNKMDIDIINDNSFKLSDELLSFSFTDGEIQVSFEIIDPFVHFKSMDEDKSMNLDEFVDNIRPFIKNKMDFSASFLENNIVTAGHEEGALQKYLEELCNGNNKYLLAERFNDSDNGNIVNFRLYFMPASGIGWKVTNWFRGGQKYENNFGKLLFVGNLFGKDGRVAREKMESLIYLTKEHLPKLGGGSVELEKKVNKKNRTISDHGYLDISIKTNDIQLIAEKEHKSMPEDKVAQIKWLRNLLEEGHKQDLSDEECVFEYKSEKNLDEKKLISQMENYEIHSLKQVEIIKKLMPNSIKIKPSYDKIIGINLYWIEDTLKGEYYSI
jgi:hypothetical protein